MILGETMHFIYYGIFFLSPLSDVFLLQDDRLQDALEDLRAKYKAVNAMLSWQPAQKPSDLNTMDF
jgi:hypothetical protein